MITAEDVSKLYLVNPFTEESEEELKEQGLDLVGIMEEMQATVTKSVRKMQQDFGFDAEQIGLAIWASALRMGFFLGKAQQAEEANDRWTGSDTH